MGPRSGRAAAAALTTSRWPITASQAEATRSGSCSRVATRRRARSTEGTSSSTATRPLLADGPGDPRRGRSSRQLVRRADLRREVCHLRVVLVFLALPDEPRREESVAFVPRYHVNVKVRDALAHA